VGIFPPHCPGHHPELFFRSLSPLLFQPDLIQPFKFRDILTFGDDEFKPLLSVATLVDVFRFLCPFSTAFFSLFVLLSFCCCPFFHSSPKPAGDCASVCLRTDGFFFGFPRFPARLLVLQITSKRPFFHDGSFGVSSQVSSHYPLTAVTFFPPNKYPSLMTIFLFLFSFPEPLFFCDTFLFPPPPVKPSFLHRASVDRREFLSSRLIFYFAKFLSLGPPFPPLRISRQSGFTSPPQRR